MVALPHAAQSVRRRERFASAAARHHSPAAANALASRPSGPFWSITTDVVITSGTRSGDERTSDAFSAAVSTGANSGSEKMTSPCLRFSSPHPRRHPADAREPRAVAKVHAVSLEPHHERGDLMRRPLPGAWRAQRSGMRAHREKTRGGGGRRGNHETETDGPGGGHAPRVRARRRVSSPRALRKDRVQSRRRAPCSPDSPCRGRDARPSRACGLTAHQGCSSSDVSTDVMKN